MEFNRTHPDLFTAAEAMVYLHLPANADRTLKTYRDKDWLVGWPVGPDGELMYWRDDLDGCALRMVGRTGKGSIAATTPARNTKSKSKGPYLRMAGSSV